MEQQLDLFNINDNPHISENISILEYIRKRAEASKRKLSSTKVEVLDTSKVSQNVKVTIPVPEKGPRPYQDLSGYLTIPWTSFCTLVRELILDTQDEISKLKSIRYIRGVFERALWNKDGPINQEFITAMNDTFENIKIDFEDHDHDSKMATIYIPNCEGIVIIGKEGSC